MQRAYSILTAKGVDEEADKYLISGIASTPTADRMGDVVDPLGAKFKTPMPLLWQHEHGKPVGNVTFAKPSKEGIPFAAELPKIKEAGALKDRVDEAIHSLKYKLVSAVSIGFRPIKDAYEYMDGGGIYFKEWDWLELSLVTIPANSEAVLDAVKSLDHKTLAALGRKSDDSDLLLPRDRGNTGQRRPIQLIPAKR